MEQEIVREYQVVHEWAAIGEDARYYSRDAFEQEVEILRAFARSRPEFLLREVSRWRP